MFCSPQVVTLFLVLKVSFVVLFWTSRCDRNMRGGRKEVPLASSLSWVTYKRKQAPHSESRPSLHISVVYFCDIAQKVASALISASFKLLCKVPSYLGHSSMARCLNIDEVISLIQIQKRKRFFLSYLHFYTFQVPEIEGRRPQSWYMYVMSIIKKKFIPRDWARKKRGEERRM